MKTKVGCSLLALFTMLLCPTVRQPVDGSGQATHLRPAAPMLYDKQLLPPRPSLLVVALYCNLGESDLSCSTLVHFRGVDTSSLAKHSFLFTVGFRSAAPEKGNKCCSVNPKYIFCSALHVTGIKADFSYSRGGAPSAHLTKQLLLRSVMGPSVTQLKLSYVFSNPFPGYGKPAPLLSRTCVMSSGLTRFVKSHEVQQLYLLPAPHWLSVLITNTNSAPWCTAKLAGV